MFSDLSKTHRKNIKKWSGWRGGGGGNASRSFRQIKEPSLDDRNVSPPGLFRFPKTLFRQDSKRLLCDPIQPSSFKGKGKGKKGKREKPSPLSPLVFPAPCYSRPHNRSNFPVAIPLCVFRENNYFLLMYCNR